jgi:hypothetical protein
MKYFLLVLLSASLFSAAAYAGNKYVRADAAGSNTGTDWANAYTALPATLTRGDTYYIADGSYGPYVFKTPNSGSTLITIRKATVADHGTNTGWSDSYGDGEALFTGNDTVWTFAPGVGYFEIFGQRAQPGVARSYGIRLYSTASRNSAATLLAPDLSGPYSSTGGNQHLYFDRVEFDWNNGTAAGAAGATRAVQWNTAVGNSGIHFTNCFVHHSSGFGIYAASIASDYVIDGCHFANNGGATTYHHETFWVTGTNGFTFRNNIIRDTQSGALTGWLMLGTVVNANIYNNVFTCSETTSCATGGNGIIGTWDSNTYANSNIQILNNTFANLPASGNPAIYFYHSGGAKDINVTVTNNVFFTVSFSVVGADTLSDSACGGGTSCPGVSAQTGLSTSMFRNWSARDFRLTSHTAPGVPTAFNSDQDGNRRDADGIWDRGAYEFSSSSTSLPAPSNLRTTSQ